MCLFLIFILMCLETKGNGILRQVKCMLIWEDRKFYIWPLNREGYEVFVMSNLV